MAAVVNVKQRTGSGGGSDTTVTDVRLCSADAANDTTHPVQKPASGTNYSYWASVFLNVVSGLSGTINNIKVFSDGALGWGSGWGLKVATAAAYTQATGTSGVSGLILSTGNYSGLTGLDDASNYTTAAPLSVGGSLTASSGKASDFIVYQGSISSTGSPGTPAAETMTIRYDES